MNEYKTRRVMEILERVIYINSTRGTRLHSDLSVNALYIYDANNGCKAIMDYRGYKTIYFDEFWDDCFDEMVEAMHEALDKYLDVSNE